MGTEHEIDPSLLGQIRIVKTPDGEIPENVRAMWVGVTLPCLFFDEHAFPVGVVSRTTSAPIRAFVVSQRQALRALISHNKDAGAYWRHIGYPEAPDARFLFSPVEAIEVIREPLPSREEYLEFVRKLREQKASA